MNSQVMAPVSTAGTAVAVGERVCVSGAGPLGWTGRVITARPGWVAVRKRQRRARHRRPDPSNCPALRRRRHTDARHNAQPPPHAEQQQVRWLGDRRHSPESLIDR
jgi:hypothetical protein